MNHSAALDAGSSKPWAFTLHGSFDPDQTLSHLPKRFHKRADEARFLMSTICRKMLAGHEDQLGFVRTDSRITQKVINWRARAPLLDAMVEQGDLQRSCHIKGERCTGFRPADKYLTDGHFLKCQPTKPIMVRKMADLKKRYYAQQAEVRHGKPIYDQLDAIQQRSLSVVESEAEPIIAMLKEQSIQRELVRRIAKHEHGNHVGKTGRWCNGLTGLKRELRPACRIDRERMGSVDLSCCQPALLGAVISSKVPFWLLKTVATYEGTLLNSVSECERHKLIAWSTDGTLYDELACVGGFERSYVKSRLIVDVLAPYGCYPSPVRDCFECEFPGVSAFIRAINRYDHGELIRLLQRVESWLVLENVAASLVDKCAIVPVHDCLFSRIRDLPIVEDAFKATFERLGFMVGMKRETWDELPTEIAPSRPKRKRRKRPYQVRQPFKPW